MSVYLFHFRLEYGNKYDEKSSWEAGQTQSNICYKSLEYRCQCNQSAIGMTQSDFKYQKATYRLYKIHRDSIRATF